MMEIKNKLFVEEAKQTIDGFVIESSIRPAMDEDIENAERLHKEGRCPHNVIQDTYAWMYDYRACFTCGKGLGAV